MQPPNSDPKKSDAAGIKERQAAARGVGHITQSLFGTQTLPESEAALTRPSAAADDDRQAKSRLKAEQDKLRDYAAGFGDGSRIVRYHKSGKWFHEFPEYLNRARVQLKIDEAADLVVSRRGQVSNDAPLNFYGAVEKARRAAPLG